MKMTRTPVLALALLSGAAFAECTVQVTGAVDNCDGNGASCYNFTYDNPTDADMLACVWDDKLKGGYVMCTVADRHSRAEFDDVLAGLSEPEDIKNFEAACITEAESEEMFEKH